MESLFPTRTFKKADAIKTAKVLNESEAVNEEPEYRWSYRAVEHADIDNLYVIEVIDEDGLFVSYWI